MTNVNGVFPASMRRCDKVYNWLYAYNSLHSQNYKEADLKTANVILLTSDPYLKRFLLFKANNNVLAIIPSTELLAICKTLKHEINKPIDISKNDAESIRDALKTRIFNGIVYVKLQHILNDRAV